MRRETHGYVLGRGKSDVSKKVKRRNVVVSDGEKEKGSQS